jgi:flagellar protein FlgJ
MKIEPTVLPEVSDSHLTDKQKADLKKVSMQFESLFTNQLLAAMRKTINKQGLIPESHAEKVYQSMLDQEYAQKMAETEHLGIAKMVYQHLLRTMPGQ